MSLYLSKEQCAVLGNKLSCILSEPGITKEKSVLKFQWYSKVLLWGLYQQRLHSPHAWIRLVEKPCQEFRKLSSQPNREQWTKNKVFHEEFLQ